MTTAGKLKVFHLDMNYVMLREETIYSLLKNIAHAGYNAVLWELEDKIRWETCPECAWPEAMGKNEFREILDYSISLGLEPIPLLQTIGHAEYVLIHVPYHHLREKEDRHDCYCVSKPETRAFLRKWIAEYLDLFDGSNRFFHLGGDEAYVFGTCHVCRNADRNSLYAAHISEISGEITKRGMRPCIWGDMVLAHPEAIDSIPKNFVIWDWNYWDCSTPPQILRIWGKNSYPPDKVPEDMKNAIPEMFDAKGAAVPFYTADFLKKHGFDVVLCSASRSYGDDPLCPNWALHSGNISGAALKTVKSGLFGNCVTSWAIRLNPYGLQMPLIELSPTVMAAPDAAPDVTENAILEKHFGFKNASRVLADISAWNNYLIPLTAVQWNGLKDSFPPPEGCISQYLKKLKEDSSGSAFIEHRDKIFADLIRKIETESAVFGSQWAPASEQGKLWHRAAELKIRLLNLMRTVFDSAYADSLPDKFLDDAVILKTDMTSFMALEQTRMSAEKNAALVMDSMILFANETSRRKKGSIQ